jgi:hypothetical protein
MAASRYPGDMSTASARGAQAVDYGSGDVVFDRATRGLYIGVAGDVAVVMATGEAVTFKNVAAGILPVAVSQVTASGTDAEDIVALF